MTFRSIFHIALVALLATTAASAVASATPTRVLCHIPDSSRLADARGVTEYPARDMVFLIDDGSHSVTYTSDSISPSVSATITQVIRFDDAEIIFVAKPAEYFSMWSQERYTINRTSGAIEVTFWTPGIQGTSVFGTCTKAEQKF